MFIRAGTFMRINTVEDGKPGRVIRRVRLNLLQLSWRFGPRYLTLLHSERPKLYTILAFLSARELK